MVRAGGGNECQGGPVPPVRPLFILQNPACSVSVVPVTRDLPTFEIEDAKRAAGFLRIAGVDEAGRGPLAGPVVSAAVILDPTTIPAGLADSKKLTARRREALFDEINAVCRVGTGIATVAEIDAMNILRAAHLSMCRAIEGLGGCDVCLIDGNMVPDQCPAPAEAVVKGDARCLSIAAASIIAKVTRDRIMVGLAQQYPGFGWERNAGYPTKAHIEALENLGVTPEHRRSFAPVHKILCREKSITL